MARPPDYHCFFEGNSMKSILRWFSGVLLGTITAFAIALLLTKDHSGQATSAGMANIGYALVFVRNLVAFGVLYGLVFPALMPGPSTKPLPSLLIGALIGAALLALLFGELDMARPGGADYFASVVWRSSIVAIAVSLPVTFFAGLQGNSMLMNARYWSRLHQAFR
jgi:hypothetical protein